MIFYGEDAFLLNTKQGQNDSKQDILWLIKWHTDTSSSAAVSIWLWKLHLSSSSSI